MQNVRQSNWKFVLPVVVDTNTFETFTLGSAITEGMMFVETTRTNRQVVMYINPPQFKAHLQHLFFLCEKFFGKDKSFLSIWRLLLKLRLLPTAGNVFKLVSIVLLNAIIPLHKHYETLFELFFVFYSSLFSLFLFFFSIRHQKY